MSNIKKIMTELSYRGPHKFLKGDLSVIGVPGSVYSPETGTGLPAVVLSHNWLFGVEKYRPFLEHLASWGIVVAAPNTFTGVKISDTDFAYDLVTSLQAITKIRLGEGKVTVNENTVGFIGHGSGCAAGVLASESYQVKSLANIMLYPTKLSDTVLDYANLINDNTVIISSEDFHSMHSGSGALAQRIPDSVLRVLPGSGLKDVTTRSITSGFIGSRNQRKNTNKLFAYITAYLLATLSDDKKYKDFADISAPIPGFYIKNKANIDLTQNPILASLFG